MKKNLIEWCLCAAVGLGLTMILGARLELDIQAHAGEPRANTRFETPATPATPTASPLASIDLNRVVLWHEASSVMLRDASPRGFAPLLLKSGWQAWVDATIRPDIEWMRSRGVKRPRVLIHLPYGVEQAGSYRFAARRNCAADPRTRHLATGLAEAIAPLTKDAEIIVYVGTLQGDAADKLYTPADAGWEWYQEISYGLGEAMTAGCSVAIDASGGYLPGDFRSHLLTMLDAMAQGYGGRLYIEPAALKGAATLYELPQIIQDQFYREQRNAAWLGEQHDELIRFAQFPADDATGRGFAGQPANVAARLVKSIAAIQQDGNTAAVAGGWLRQAWANGGGK